MRDPIRIGDKWIGDTQPLFIMAEVGVTCNYDLEITRKLIDAAADAGADAVKFIFWFPDEIMSDRSVTYTYETQSGARTENMYEMLEKLRFSLEQWGQVKAHADARGITMFSTVNSPGGIRYAQALGLEAYKLSSWDYTYLPLWKKIASFKKPMLIDTGPVHDADVEKVMRVMREAGNDQHILVHCFHTAEPAEMNLRAIPYMRKAYDTLVGYSSKDQESDTDIMAIALGAVVVEKRLTLSRDLPGHHHVLCLEPGEFADYVKRMRQVHAALGKEALRPSRADLEERKRWFRHLVANQDIPKGTVLDTKMLEAKRPETGVSPEHWDAFIGKRTKRDLIRDGALSWQDVE